MRDAQRPGRWPPTCVDEGRVGHNPARTYGAIAVELRVYPPLILSLNLSHRVLPLNWAFHIFHQNFTRDKESRHWVRTASHAFTPPQLLACTPTPLVGSPPRDSFFTARWRQPSSSGVEAAERSVCMRTKTRGMGGHCASRRGHQIRTRVCASFGQNISTRTRS